MGLAVSRKRGRTADPGAAHRAIPMSRPCWRFTAAHIRDGGRGSVSDAETPQPDDLRDRPQETCAAPLPPFGGDARRRGGRHALCWCWFANGRPIATRSNTRSMSVTRQVGQGIGRILMQELIDVCAAQAFGRLSGYIDAYNAAPWASCEGSDSPEWVAAGCRLSARPLGRYHHGSTPARRSGSTTAP